MTLVMLVDVTSIQLTTGMFPSRGRTIVSICLLPCASASAARAGNLVDRLGEHRVEGLVRLVAAQIL